jgi:hypothetical protein
MLIFLIAYLIYPVHPGEAVLAMSNRRFVFVLKSAGVIVASIACIATLIYYGVEGTKDQRFGIRILTYALTIMVGIGIFFLGGKAVGGKVSEYLRRSLTWMYVKMWFSRSWYSIKNFIFIQQFGTTKWMKWLIALELAVIIGYFTLPWITKTILIRNGTILLEEIPVKLGVQRTMMTYDPTSNTITNIYNVPDRDSVGKYFLHGIANIYNEGDEDAEDTEDAEGAEGAEGGADPSIIKDVYTYNYGISGWFFIESGTTMHDTLLLNYGERPAIYFNSRSNKLVVKTKHGNEMEELFSEEAFPLQKWNHLVVNYVGGTLDVFVNGELVVSRKGVLEYDANGMSLDVGNESGVAGGVKQMVYYHTPLSKQDIDRLGAISTW